MRHTLNLSLSIATESKFTDEAGWEPVYKVKIEKLSELEREEALRAIEMFSQPLETNEILQLMARLQVISPEKERADIDAKARAAVWVEELRLYPADIVKKALKARYRWFPSLAEVLDRCDEEMSFRKLIKDAFRFYRAEISPI